MRYLAPFIALLLLSTIAAKADPPAIDGIFPISGPVGKSIPVTFSGKTGTWPPKFWFSKKGFHIDPGEKSPDATITISPDTEPGPVLIRAYNAEGTSEPFFINATSEKLNHHIEDQKSDNRGFDKAQPVDFSFPFVINGKLHQSRDIDFYRFNVSKPGPLHIKMKSYTFRTGVDGILHLYNQDGTRIELAHDTDSDLDPVIETNIKSPGNYAIAVMGIATPPNANVHFHGGANCNYQVVVSNGSIERAVLDEDQFITLEEVPKHEVIHTCTKGTTYLFRAEVTDFHFPTDPVLAIYRPDGKLLKEVDDLPTKERDAEYTWKCSADGDYKVTVFDRFGRTGKDFKAKLIIEEATPDFAAALVTTSIKAKAGEEAKADITITRTNGHKAPLKLKVEGLPDHITPKVDEIPEGTKTISVKFISEKNSPPFSGPIRFIVESENGNKTAVYQLQDKDSRGPYAINELQDIWLTITAASENNSPDQK